MSNTFGIDLGTCNVKVFCKATGKVLNEKNIVQRTAAHVGGGATETDENTVAIVNKNQMYAYGDHAYAM